MCSVSCVQALSGAVAEISNLFWACCFGSLAEPGGKPWLSVFFHMLRKPTLQFLQLGRKQVAELEDLMTGDLTVSADSMLSDIREDWKLLECSGREARPTVWQDALRWKQGLAWLKFGDWACHSVKPCAEEKQVAAFFLRLIEARVPVHLVELEQKAIDAFASEREAGLGGWWLPVGSQLEVVCRISLLGFDRSLRRVSLQASNLSFVPWRHWRNSPYSCFRDRTGW